MKKYIYQILFITFFIGCAGSSSDSSFTADGSGKGGSMARFAISGDYLYTVNSRSLEVFDISIPDDPVSFTHTFDVPFDVETLYSYEDHIYLGSQSGMFIYTKPTESTDLEQVGSFYHVKSCDPVVVNDGLAFVTLDSSSSCRVSKAEANELEIIDINDTSNPKLLYTQKNYLKAPMGLGVDSGKVFVCDREEGLKIFDINKTKDDTNQTVVSLNFDRNNSILDLECSDLIAHNKLLIISSKDSVKQYDYTHFPMQKLSDIK